MADPMIGANRMIAMSNILSVVLLVKSRLARSIKANIMQIKGKKSAGIRSKNTTISCMPILRYRRFIVL